MCVKIVETRVYRKYESWLHKDIYCCAKIKCWRMSQVEIKLFNEINFVHSDGQFSKQPFNDSDIIIKLEDATSFYDFIMECCNKLLNKPSTMTSPCGFIRINRESVVPYTLVGDKKYMPLFYFEGEIDNIKSDTIQITGWELSYLKFCCKVQGIRSELYDFEYISVICLDEIKKYFPANTEFEDFWPTKITESLLLNKPNQSHGVNNVNGYKTIIPQPQSASKIYQQYNSNHLVGLNNVRYTNIDVPVNNVLPKGVDAPSNNPLYSSTYSMSGVNNQGQTLINGNLHSLPSLVISGGDIQRFLLENRSK